MQRTDADIRPLQSERVGADGVTVDDLTAVPLLGLCAERVARPDGTLDPGLVLVDPLTGTIADVVRTGTGHAGTHLGGVRGRLLDLGDRTVAAGFVDVHVHGGAGRQVNGDSAGEVEDSLEIMAALFAAHGTTSFLATTVSDSPGRLEAAVEGAARATRKRLASCARVIGCHLEGPYLSPHRAGAQDPRWIRPPDRAELARLLELGEGTLRIVTLAPELQGAAQLISDCLDAGAVVALGHTDADFDTALRALDSGARHVTHLFDAMAPLHHRRPGLVAAALLDDRVTLELICDLHHVHPAVVGLVSRLAPQRMVLVTDAVAAGLRPGRHVLGRKDVVLEGGRVSLLSEPSTLAGSVLTMDVALRHAVHDAGVPLAVALAAASSVPSAVIGEVQPAAGVVAPGATADLVVLGRDLHVVATFVGGKVAFDPAGLLA